MAQHRRQYLNEPILMLLSEKVSVAVVNEELTVFMKETWEMPVPETEPEPEPTESEIVTEEVQ